MTAQFYIAKFTKRHSVKDGVTRIFNTIMLADSDPSPMTRLSTELEWRVTDEDLTKLGADENKFRGQLVHVAVKGIASNVFKGVVQGLPVITCEFIEYVKPIKAL